MHHDPAILSTLSTLSAMVAGALVVMLVALTVSVAIGIGRPGWRGIVFAGAVGGAVFQLAHLAEHGAQVGYWSSHRDQPPWMTPWASALARSFGSLAPGTPGFGMEALHLVGNLIFLVGGVAILAVLARSGNDGGGTLARTGVVVQAVHLAEHVALTSSVLLVGRPIGVSTWFGTIDPGPGLWTYRVMWHFVVNAVPTALLALAVARRERHVRRVATPNAQLTTWAAGPRVGCDGGPDVSGIVSDGLGG